MSGTKQTQKQKFIEAAKKHGCDSNEHDFDDKLSRIAKHQVEKPTKK
jgi:hypothetical protein